MGYKTCKKCGAKIVVSPKDGHGMCTGCDKYYSVEKLAMQQEWGEISRGIAALSDAEFKAFNQRMMEGK